MRDKSILSRQWDDAESQQTKQGPGKVCQRHGEKRSDILEPSIGNFQLADQVFVFNSPLTRRSGTTRHLEKSINRIQGCW